MTYPNQRHILKCVDTTEQENSIITDTQKVNGEMQHIMTCVSTAVLWETVNVLENYVKERTGNQEL